MFVYKRIQMAFLLLFSCIILAACSEQNKPDATAKEETEEKTAVTDEIPVASLELEGMIAQEPGKLLELHMEPNIEAAETKDFWTYNNFYEDTFEPIMHEAADGLFLGK